MESYLADSAHLPIAAVAEDWGSMSVVSCMRADSTHLRRVL